MRRQQETRTHLGNGDESIIPPKILRDEKLIDHPQADHDGTWTKDHPVHSEYGATQVSTTRHWHEVVCCSIAHDMDSGERKRLEPAEPGKVKSLTI